MEVIDGATGEIRRAEVFVGVLGASSYVFAQATWTQSLPDWIAAHVNMLAAIDGVTRQIVSDNLRAGIAGPASTSAGQPHLCRYGVALRHRGDPGASVQTA